MPTTSDPAAELHAMCSLMAEFPIHRNANGLTALAAMLDVQANTSEYFMAIGAIAARFHGLQQLAEDILDEPHRPLLVASLHSLQSAISAPSQVTAWSSIRDQAFSAANMNTLMMASAFVRQHAPISIPTADERSSAIAAIDEALETLKNHHGTLSRGIYSALLTTRRMLERFDLYGADSLSDELIKAFALKSASEGQRSAGTTERAAWTKAWGAMLMVASFLVAADAGITAIENHYGRAQAVLAYFAAEQKQLPPPSSNFANSPAVKPEEGQE